MNSWRDAILKELLPGISRVTIVEDPDGLLLEESIIQEITGRGFEILTYEDPIAFRYLYESKYRSNWDKGLFTGISIIIRVPDLKILPYDIQMAGRKLSYGIGKIFPGLSFSVVSQIDKNLFDKLYISLNQYNPGILGENSTKDFVLRHLYGIAPEIIKTESDLLRVLIQRHYRRQILPPVLDERFIQILGQKSNFQNWPLKKIIPNRDSFFEFLQERWEYFVNSNIVNSKINKKEEIDLKFSGPVNLPFGHDNVRVYIDNLFTEGFLQQIKIPIAKKNNINKEWVFIGISDNKADEQIIKIETLITSIEEALSQGLNVYQDWLSFGYKWAQLNVIWNDLTSTQPAELSNRFFLTQEKIDSSFEKWMTNRFGALHFQSSSMPVMLHQVPKYLSRINEDKKTKIALLVVDGMSAGQWLVIREEIKKQKKAIKYKEDLLYAWVPTITAVSRQALFAGKPPYNFPSSIQTTDKEEKLWKQFWTELGFSQSEIIYMKGLGDVSDLSQVDEAITHPKVKIAGLVVDKVDQIMHGMVLGMSGMQTMIRQWAKTNFLLDLLAKLDYNGFKIFITSDHGNTESIGCGLPSEGSVADLRGERVRIYPDESLRKRVKEKYPNSIEWPSVGLPNNYCPLIANKRFAFTRENEKSISHGGISIDEVLIPFIEIESENKNG